MENYTVWDRNLLLELLTSGEDQIKQLDAHLNEPSQTESCKILAQGIRSIFRRAISMAKLGDPEEGQQLACPIGTDDCPLSASDSPLSEGSDKSAFKDLEHREEMCKKRKTLPKWTSQVIVGSGPGAEPPLDDGFCWRKYGQKDILGAKHPRAYYRCTHRHTRGCVAMKQVQRSDENSSVFDVTYRGEHTCNQTRKWASAAMPKAPKIQKKQNDPPDQSQQQYHQDQSLLMNFRANLKVKTEVLDSEGQGLNDSSFSFPTTPVSCLTPKNSIFASPPPLESHIMGSFPSAFISPTASESAYFSVSPSWMSNYGVEPIFHAAESDVTEIISAMTSATNSPTVDMDFFDLDSTFQLDASDFY